jgi:hypothetical protein
MLPVRRYWTFFPLDTQGASVMKSSLCSITGTRTRLFIAAACVMVSAHLGATIVTPSATVTVTESFAYTSYNGGDFVFSTSGTATGCSSGWYISSGDPGYKAAVAAVLAAQVAGSYIIVYGDNSALWSGSPSGKYCHVQTVGIAS